MVSEWAPCQQSIALTALTLTWLSTSPPLRNPVATVVHPSIQESLRQFFRKLFDIFHNSLIRLYLLRLPRTIANESQIWGSHARVLQRLERVSLRVFRWSELSPGIEVLSCFGQLLATRLCLWWRLSASRPLVLELAIVLGSLRIYNMMREALNIK